MEGLLAVHPPIRLNFIPKPRRRLVSIFSYGPGLIPSPRMSGRVYFSDGLFRNSGVPFVSVQAGYYASKVLGPVGIGE